MSPLSGIRWGLLVPLFFLGNFHTYPTLALASPDVAAQPQPHLQRQAACSAPCGFAAQFCCSAGEVCVTNTQSIASCSITGSVTSPEPSPYLTIQTQTSLASESEPLYTIQTQTSLSSTRTPSACSVPCLQYCCAVGEMCISSGSAAYCSALPASTTVGSNASNSIPMSITSSQFLAGNTSTPASTTPRSTSAVTSAASTTIQPVTGHATTPQSNNRLVVGVLALLAAIFMAAIL